MRRTRRGPARPGRRACPLPPPSPRVPDVPLRDLVAVDADRAAELPSDLLLCGHPGPRWLPREGPEPPRLENEYECSPAEHGAPDDGLCAHGAAPPSPLQSSAPAGRD